MIKNILSIKLRKAFVLSASFLFLFNACKKDEEKIKPQFTKETENGDFTDQLKLSTTTILSDSILADKVSIGLAGAYKDSAFGTSIAYMQLQTLLPSNYLKLGEDNETLITDSIVLSLAYDGSFGDSTSQTFEVHEITEELQSGQPYPSNTNISVNAAVLGSKTFSPKLKNKVKVYRPNATGGVDTITVDPQLRIRLDNALGDKILSKSGQSELANGNNFKAFFNGVKIGPAASPTLSMNEDAILYFTITSSATKMSLYYSAVKSNGDTLKKVIDFPINSSSVRFNTFTHDYTGSAVETSLLNPAADSIYTYTQGMAGVQTLIEFPDIKQQFKKGKVTINKAQLVLPVVGGSYAKFGLAQKLILATRNANGELTFIPDFFEGEAYFDRKYDASKHQYVFNINRYIQDVIDGTVENRGLVVLTTGSAVKADRAVFYGPSHTGNKMKLNLYYSNKN